MSLLGGGEAHISVFGWYEGLGFGLWDEDEGFRGIY